ncbi:MAG TPA: pyridoxal phosphate-dependent aminotransferase [Thermoanaerobaculia bacterium]|nr:pyridoxal phosphate-dependent aminotransferase [Thermoanaerobaculia bacterium]
MRFSSRAPWDAGLNRLSIALAERRHRGEEILDLTISNPTAAGIDYPSEGIAEAFAWASAIPYRPAPLGLPAARETVAEELGCDADDIIITASTSEAYSYLFKLLMNAGDEVVSAVPSYPLLEHLASLEGVLLRTFPLDLHQRWEVDPGRLRTAVSDRTAACVLVNPNNPLGVYATPAEQDILAAIGVPVVADEVFFEYPLSDVEPRRVIREDILCFSLGGLSKSCGMPHYKLGWMRLSGPRSDVDRARAGLELIADQYLSVSTPVQEALPDLLRLGAQVREEIQRRIGENYHCLRETAAGAGPARLLPVEGGWSAVIRVPAVEHDDDLVLRLLGRGVLVQPGYFFDFERDGYLVISLLTPPEVFAKGVARLLAAIAEDA